MFEITWLHPNFGNIERNTQKQLHALEVRSGLLVTQKKEE